MSESSSEWVRRAIAARRAQGLPERVTDPAVLRRVARILAGRKKP